MEEALTCKKCKQTSSLPPSAQRIRCLGCQTLLSLSTTADAARSTTQELRLDLSKKKTEAKDLCSSLRRKLPFSTTTPPLPPQNTPFASLHSEPRPGRRALLCGVSYKKQKHELKGTALDVKKMKLLLESFRFPQESVLVLMEEGGFLPPTRENIEEGLRWLVRGIRPGDSLVFFFSGHGKRQREEVAGDEIDGFDETICPVDFEEKGMIVDNFINRTIVRPLVPGVTLHAIIESCHSGTILDLPHVCNARGEWEDNSPPSGAYKGTKGGKAICFSACEDYQLAADTTLLSSDREMTGAMTITFIKAIKESQERKEKISYKGIMDSMHNSIKEAGKSGGIFAGIRRRFHRRILQDPLLSSTEEFDTSSEFNL
ncbi:metacaspase-1-like [Salvia hispanica]|uniref:metacaspase-1-like n=1 Tax=Salvia hispanica TaxID=49212 RepID=UPI002009D253|nr:metacaspase-1-like [Salvia hispanica]